MGLLWRRQCTHVVERDELSRRRVDGAGDSLTAAEKSREDDGNTRA